MWPVVLQALLAPQLWPLYALGLLSSTNSQVVPGSTAQDRIRRALFAAKHCKAAYAMGQGGTNPALLCPTANGLCDCSGFIAWVLGIIRGPRRTRPTWIETSNIYKDARFTQQSFVALSAPRPGCLLVYPDPPGGQGHVALLTHIKGGQWYGVDCSSGVYKRTGQAITLRNLDFFRGRPGLTYAWPLPAIWSAKA